MAKTAPTSPPVDTNLQIERWPIDRLVLYARNLRKNDSFEVIAAEREKGAVGITRCRREIAEIETLLGNGHPDLPGQCLALTDWSTELRLIERELGLGAAVAR